MKFCLIGMLLLSESQPTVQIPRSGARNQPSSHIMQAVVLQVRHPGNFIPHSMLENLTEWICDHLSINTFYNKVKK